MTRVIVYSTALVAFVAATAMTFASIFLPNWISWDVSTSTGGHFTKTIGLHRSCSSVDGHVIISHKLRIAMAQIGISALCGGV